MAIGRGVMPRLDSIDARLATSAAMLEAPPSSCQLMMAGSVPLALASVKNVVIQLELKVEVLGPWMGAPGSRERTSLKVRAQPASKEPACAGSHVQSRSFHSSKALMLLSPEARTALTCVSTAPSQSFQLTHL